jgi:hypothetical protein
MLSFQVVLLPELLFLSTRMLIVDVALGTEVER